MLYNPKTKEVYTLNTNQTAKIDEKNSGNVLQNGAEDDIIQTRKYIQDPKTGKMMGSTSDKGESPAVVFDSKGNPYKYPTVILSKEEYGTIIRQIDDAYHIRYIDKSIGYIQSREYLASYAFEIHGYNEYNIFRKDEDL